MACPFFYPTEWLDQGLWPHPSRLPLGAGFGGQCRAQEGEPHRPDVRTLTECCNLGYAAPGCGRFPTNGAPEAVRFTVASDARGVIEVRYVVEKGYLPHEHGKLEFERRRGCFRPAPSNAVLARQAEVYVENYRRRRGEIPL